MGRTGWNTKVIVSQKWVYMRLKNNTRKGKTKSKSYSHPRSPKTMRNNMLVMSQL